jgi:uncharacterized protein YciW
MFAEAHGIDPDHFEQLVTDPQKAGISKRLLPILAYAKKLTLAPSTVTEADAKLVYDAGWGEEALFTAISVAALFNLMNRLVEGTGITANEMMRQASKERISKDLANPHPYADFARAVQAEHDKRYGQR